jgi:PAS domain S-box-containing protein
MSRAGRHNGSAQAPGLPHALEQALQGSSGLLESLPIGIYACDVDGKLSRYNRYAAELWGLAPPLGEPFADPLMAELLSTAQAVRDREQVIQRPDGSPLTILANLDPLRDENGVLIGGVCCFQDITARKEEEDRLKAQDRWYRDLLEALPAAIYTTDAEGRITFFNQAAAELAGRKPTIGDDRWCVTFRLYHPDGQPLAHSECPMAVALKSGQAVRGTEKIAERPDGTRIPILPYPTPIHDLDGQLVGAVNMLVDISQQKRAEEERTQLLRELAHRVNNTFAVILAIAQQSLRTAPSTQAFVEAFSGRLQALAQAHNLLLAKDWNGADLAELAKGQLAPFANGRDNCLKLEGPKVVLEPGRAIALGVVLHELGANAARYGALSAACGRVELSWRLEGYRVVLTWTERDGPRVAPPARKGLGSKLIERGLPNAAIDWRFQPEGVVCEIELPLATRKAETVKVEQRDVKATPRSERRPAEIATTIPA